MKEVWFGFNPACTHFKLMRVWYLQNSERGKKETSIFFLFKSVGCQLATFAEILTKTVTTWSIVITISKIKKSSLLFSSCSSSECLMNWSEEIIVNIRPMKSANLTFTQCLMIRKSPQLFIWIYSQHYPTQLPIVPPNMHCKYVSKLNLS